MKCGGSNARWVFMCNQKWRKHTVNGNKRRRPSDPAHKHDCNEKATILYRTERLCIKFSHDTHSGILLAEAISFATTNKIIQLSEDGLCAFQLMSMLRSEGSSVYLYNTVYNIWFRSISAKFRNHADPTIFDRLSVQESEKMELYVIKACRVAL